MISDNILNLLMVVGFIALILFFKFISQNINQKGKQTELDEVYMDVLNSDQYKVKGRFE